MECDAKYWAWRKKNGVLRRVSKRSVVAAFCITDTTLFQTYENDKQKNIKPFDGSNKKVRANKYDITDLHTEQTLNIYSFG